MTTHQDEPQHSLPSIAARYQKAALSPSTQQLAQALAMLQRSAAGAIFPREAKEEDLPAPPLVITSLRQASDTFEQALLARRRRQTTEREASRLYAGARPFI